MSIYKLEKEFLSLLQKQQLEIFLEEFKTSSKKNTLEIKIEKRGYSVNDKFSKIIDSKIHTIGFFSGAGGLDIGAQLAGSKVISSLDFDKDSVDTMKSNKYFSHTIHLQKDIKEITSKDYS